MKPTLVNKNRSKFIELRHKFIKEQVQTKIVDIRNVKYAKQEGDILTEPIGTFKHVNNSKRIGVEEIFNIDRDTKEIWDTEWKEMKKRLSVPDMMHRKDIEQIKPLPIPRKV